MTPAKKLLFPAGAVIGVALILFLYFLIESLSSESARLPVLRVMLIAAGVVCCGFFAGLMCVLRKNSKSRRNSNSNSNSKAA